jgi:TRAP-type C4-dicarboxylate transport system substrate-binding protein
MPGFKYRRVMAGAVGALSALAILAGPAAAQKYVVKLGHPLPPKTGLHVWAEYLKAGIEKRSAGRMEVKIYPVSQLGTIPRMIEGAQLGTIEIITMPPAFFTGLDRRFGVLAAPGIFTDIEHGQRVVHDPEFKKVFWPIAESKGLKMIGMSCDAPSDYATVTPIRKLADFKGRKLRVFGSKLEIETLRRVGATGVPMPLSEVIPAIQRKVIDGNKAAIVVFVPFRYQSIAKYVLRAKASIICITKFASKVWFDKLPRDLQQIVLEEAAIADKRIISFSVALIDKLYKVWETTGGELNELSPAEQAELRRRLSTVGDDVLKDRPEVLKVYKIMKAVAARTRTK